MATEWRYPDYANKPGHFDTEAAVNIALTQHDAGRDEIVQFLAKLTAMLHETGILADRDVENLIGYALETVE